MKVCASHYFILIVFCFFSSACSSRPKFEKAYSELLSGIGRKAFSVAIFENGKRVHFKNENPGDKVGLLVKGILDEKRMSWIKSKYVSYAPRLVFTTDGMSLNVTESVIVLNLSVENGRWEQYVCNTNKSQFECILNIVKMWF